MMRAGSRNLITDVPGLAVGNADDAAIRSGVTVVLPDDPAAAAVDARGGATGTRDIDALKPDGAVARVDAIVLAGGSAYGLDAAGGVMAWLAARGRGYDVGGRGVRVPIVPQAILFDLWSGGDTAWTADDSGAATPYRALAIAAAAAAAADFALGNAGAGLGATAGSLKGGLGSASIVAADGVAVGVLAAVNARGSVLLDATGVFNAWPCERDGEFGGRRPDGRTPPITDDAWLGAAVPAANTTLAIVATDLALDRAALRRVAIQAHDGLARAIRPAHTPFDGDCVFALSTGRRAPADRLADIARVGSMAADCVARAVARGVYAARSLGGMVAWRDRFAGG